MSSNTLSSSSIARERAAEPYRDDLNAEFYPHFSYYGAGRIGWESKMDVARVIFESFDEQAKAQAEAMLKEIGAACGGQRVTLSVEGDLVQILRRFLQIAARSDCVAYGPLGSEVSPEQAGKILNISSPLVDRRMTDGRLPFHFVGSHRRCKLSDVLALKTKEELHGEDMRRMYEEFDSYEP